MRRRVTRRGLTLLELMIVLIILVGLLAIVGPRLLGSQKKADIRTAQAQIGNIESALEMYYVDMKNYPDSETGLAALLEAPDDERAARNWSGPYLDEKKLPLDPWGNEYGYENEAAEEGGENKPRIFSNGPDGEPDTDDDIANRSRDGESSDEEESTGGSGGSSEN